MEYPDTDLDQLITEKGFLDLKIDKNLDLVNAIRFLAKEKNAVILGHFYITPELQDISDYVGDSLGLSQNAAKTEAEMIVFLGVHFMAETAKILNPGKKVLIPDVKASCSLAESAPVESFEAFKKKYPDHKVVSYINCTADIKAMSDVICTSSNAVKIVESFPVDEKLIFAPDKNLGNYINGLTGRNMVLWDGACMVHEMYSLEKVLELKEQYPDAKFIAHPECEKPLLLIADFIGSTTEIYPTGKCKTIYCSYRKRHPSPDEKIISGKRIYSGSFNRCKLCLQRLFLYETEYPAEIILDFEI